MQEYHPQRTSSPEIRVTFEIDQPRYSVDGWEMGSGAAQYPLYVMENEMKHRLNTRGCGLVTHMSIERVGSGDAGGWADTDGATLRLWCAAEAGDVQSVQQELERLPVEVVPRLVRCAELVEAIQRALVEDGLVRGL